MKLLSTTLAFLSICFHSIGYTQSETGQDPLPVYSIQFFAEGYYGLSTYEGRKDQEEFYYNHHSLRSPKINYAQVLFEKKLNTWQFQLGIHDGIYVRRNYADQPQWAQLLSHANIQYSSQHFIGLKILAGIFPSHIGFESARTDANLTASRSMLAENSPYYESGIQCQYQPLSNKWQLGLYLLTGWQQAHIELPAKRISMGWSSRYNIADNWGLFYNGFSGFTHTASYEKRSYHNFYSQMSSQRWTGIVGFDYGTAQIQGINHQWYSPVAILQYQRNNHLKFAFRYEYMQVPSAAFILIDQNYNYDRRSAISANIDFKSNKNWLLRLEYKQAWGLGYLPGQKDMQIKNNNLILLSLSKSFQLSF